jgi:drug/metabolite transporter (DMT)-like permease
LFVLLRGSTFVPEAVTTGDYLAVVWLGLIPGIVGHGLLNWAVRKLPVHTVSLAVLLEPAGAALLAWALLGEQVGVRETAGAAVLLAGVAVGLPWRK